MLTYIEEHYEGRGADDEPEEDVDYHSPEVSCF